MEAELIHFISQIPFLVFQMRWRSLGYCWDPVQGWISLWDPPAGHRGEMTLCLLLPHFGTLLVLPATLPRVISSDTQMRSRNPIGFAFLISRVLCSNKFKSSSIYKFHPWSKVNQSTCGIWISVPWEWFIVFEFSLCFYWGK